MKQCAGVLVLNLALLVITTAYVQAHGVPAKEPLWAYGFLTPPSLREKARRRRTLPRDDCDPNEDPEEQMRPRHLDGTAASTRWSTSATAKRDRLVSRRPPAPMPDVIKHGPKQLGDTKRGCGSCHLPNGKGRPENAQPGGLPVTYIIRQIEDFRLGFRRSADWRKPNTTRW